MATVSTREQDKLPDSDFAYVAPGGKKDSTGKTVPRSKRHLLIKDAAHVKNAEARFNQTRFHSAEAKRSAWNKIVRAAGKFGVKLAKTLGANGQLVDKKSAHATAGRDAGATIHIATFSVVVEGKAPEWIELIPGAEFNGRDGRGPFTMRDPDAVIRATAALKMDGGIPIDYDHATDFGAPHGNPAPAAGWIRKLEVRSGALWGQVEWTEEGAAAIEKKHYKYVSPVFTYDKPAGAGKDDERGEVQRLLRAALTNNPNLELTAIAASNILTEAGMAKSAHAKKSKLDALVEQIQEAAEEIGMPVDSLLEGISHKLGGDLEDPDQGGGDGDEPDDAAAEGAEGYESEEDMARRHAGEMARCADDDRDEMMARHKREREEMARRIAEESRHANADRGHGGPRHRQPNISRMVASHPSVVKMARELSDLRAERAREKAEIAVNTAIRERRLTPSQREWAIEYCLENPDGFTKFVAAQPVIVDDGGTFRGTPAANGGVALSRTESAVCNAFHLEPAKFAEHHKALMSSRSAGRTLE
jgi:phage I-like protein